MSPTRPRPPHGQGRRPPGTRRAPTPSWSEAPLSAALPVRDVDRLDPADVPAVLALLRAAAAADGARPLSEEAELRLQHGGPAGGRDVLATAPDGMLAGYARFEGGDGTVDAEAQLVVAPGARRRGMGSALLTRLEGLAGDRPLRVWAHGDLPGSAQLARRHGYQRARVLLQLRRDLAGVDPAPRLRLPEGVRVRTFRPGRDEPAWLRTNARAFAGHPEQGSWSADDLLLREAEPWFDPAGFFLAEDGGTLLGSHWTKVHPPGDEGPEAVGEVYVLGIDPDAQGLGLGRALTDVGLAHLRSLGLRQVLLYVDEDNTAAVTLYERSGFTRYAVDVSWRRAR